MKVQAESFHLNGSHHRISSADSKVRLALQNSIKHSGSEGVKEAMLCHGDNALFGQFLC